MNDMDRLQAEIATASHNLREPLRMIRCYADLLAERPEDSGVCIERINQGAQRLETLLNGMFECFQIPEHFHPAATNMNLVFNNALARLAPAERAAVTADELPTVHGDFEILTEVLSRLIDNALKFRGEQAPEIHFSVTRGPGSDQWHFTAKDNGIGIEAAHWERCFGMFKRLHPRDVPGEGFGLAYCRRAVELHGGRIWLESVPGSGTTVFFTLPAG
jgi:signal transduction histidine kinase